MCAGLSWYLLVLVGGLIQARLSSVCRSVSAIKRVEEVKQRRQAQFIKNRCVCLKAGLSPMGGPGGVGVGEGGEWGVLVK